jgi:deoxyribose-phosphate aldolase
MILTPVPLVRKMELALLAPELSRQQVQDGCAAALRYDCVSVFVKPHYTEVARKALKDTHAKVISVIGFPHGGVTTATKMYETQDLCQRGADELAMVINLGAVRDHDDLAVRNDIAGVIKTARGKPITVILETPLLTDEDKARACKLAEAAGAVSIMTATGFAASATMAADVRLLRATCPNLKVRAAGGIHSQADALAMLESGAALVVLTNVEQVLSA